MDYSTYLIKESTLTELANAVKSLYSTSSSLTISQMLSIISSYMFDPPEILSYQYCYCNNISKFIAGSNTSKIGSSAFSGCSQLLEVSFPNCTLIDSYAFGTCANLTKVEFPNCTEIYQGAFSGCTNLSQISFPNCSIIGAGAFSGCTNLPHVSFPNCSIIRANVFFSCTNLSQASFPNCLSVSGYAFRRCTNLGAIWLPTCKFISNHVFSDCYNLSSIYLTNVSSVPTTGTNFTQSTIVSSAIYAYVPQSLVEDFRAASYWSLINIVGI